MVKKVIIVILCSLILVIVTYGHSFNRFVPAIPFIVIIAMDMIKEFSRYLYNNAQPKTPIKARIIEKSDSGVGGKVGSTYTFSINMIFYVTFEIISSGETKKFHVPDYDYDKAFEGSNVILTLQGNRYIGFEPIKSD